MNKINSRFKITLFFFLFSIGLIFTFVLSDMLYFSNQLENTLLKNAIVKIKEKENYLLESINTAKNTLSVVKESILFNKYLSDKQIYQKSVEDLFITISKNDKNIMQFRYIDAEGNENIRINRKKIGDEVNLIQSKQLQNKTNRYYYEDSKNKKMNVAWLSNLDLNEEYGIVEKPYIPTIRAILPIQKDEKFEGIIIINYFMKNILTKISTTPLYDLTLFNARGYPLIHYNKNLNWSFYKSNKYTIQNDFPKNFDIILSRKVVQNRKFISKQLDISTPEKLFITLQLKQSYLNEQQMKKTGQYILISLFIFCISVVMSFIFSKHIQELLTNLASTKRSNNTLKNKIFSKNKALLKANNQLNELNNNLEKKVLLEIKKNKEKEIQLASQAKMAAMGDMIGNIAHQWRQPLSIISTIASGVKLQYKHNHLDIKELPNQMNEIVVKTKYLSETIDTFRNFLKGEKEFKETVLQDCINDALKIVEPSLKDNYINLHKNLKEENKIIHFTISNELGQVIVNIINNAKDAIMENEIIKAWIKIDLEKIEKDILITIEDNAGGISTEIISKIFEPYFTTKHKSQGTGLGLHLSYSIITESLKGEIYVENSRHGAKFFIKLPSS
jgi:signal transduction histidine kinase